MADPVPARKPGKYQPLASWLATQPGPTVTLSLIEVARILGDPLPAAAHVHSEWWTSHAARFPQIEAWRAVGWEVASVNPQGLTVTFVRTAGKAPW
jgi:hypothetical protein